MLILDFIAKNTDVRDGRAQDIREMEICRKKMDYCKHHLNFDQHRALQMVDKIKKDWSKASKKLSDLIIKFQ